MSFSGRATGESVSSKKPAFLAVLLSFLLMFSLVMPASGRVAAADPGGSPTPPAAQSSDFVVQTIEGVKTVTEWTGSGSEIVIPEGVQAVADSVFYNKALTKVTFPQSLIQIGESAFAHNEIETISAAGLEVLAPYAFADNKITTVNTPNLVKTSDFAFANNKLQDFTQTSGTIGRNSFIDNQLKSLNIVGVTEIGDGAFVGNQLTEVQLGDPVKVGQDAFAGNSNWVVLHTTDLSITTQASTNYSYGQLVNQAILTVEFLAEDTGAKIAPDRVYGKDLTQEIYSLGDTIEFQVPQFDGYRRAKPSVSVTFESVNQKLTLKYVAQNDLPKLGLRDEANTSKVVKVDPNVVADKAFLVSLVKAVDLNGTDISDRITVNPSSVDTTTAHSELVTYSVTDDFGNTATLDVTIFVGTDLLNFDLGWGWKLGDFEYYGNSVVGFKLKSYEDKLATNPNIVLPHINPYTGQIITDIAGKTISWTCKNDYQRKWVEEHGSTCPDGPKTWWWVNSTKDFDGRARTDVGNVPAGAKLDGGDKLFSSDNVVPFGGVDKRFKTKFHFYPGNQIQTISSLAFGKSPSKFVVVAPGGDPGSVDPEDNSSIDFANAQALQEIGAYAFYKFIGSAEPVKLTNLANLKYVGESAFMQISASEIIVSNNPKLTGIDSTAFLWSSAKAITVEGNPQLVSIGERAFNAINDAASVIVKGNPSLNQIGEQAFGDIYKTTTFVCENCAGLTDLGAGAFSRRRSNPPSSWKELDFTSAPNLDTSKLGADFVQNASGHPDYHNKVVIRVTDEVAARTPSRYNYLVNPCPVDQVPPADQPANWQSSDFAYSIDSRGQATVLGFSGCGAMKAMAGHRDVVLPATDTSGRIITGIADTPFAGYDITGLDASGTPTLTTIAGVLTDKRNMSRINLSGTRVEHLPAVFFTKSRNLTEVDLSNTPIREIPDGAFEWASSLKKVNLDGANQLTRIGNKAFWGKRHIEGFDLAKLLALEEIGEMAFAQSPQMFSEVDFSKNPKLKTIGNQAFMRMNLTNVTFDNPALTTIGDSAFALNKISDLDLSKTVVTSIGEFAFSNNKITEARIPHTLQELKLVKTTGYSPFLYNPGVNSDRQVILRTPDGVNPAGPADLDYVSRPRGSNYNNDGWLINPITVTVEARLSSDNSLLRSTQLYVAEDTLYTNPGIGTYIPDQDSITLTKKAANYTVTVPYRLVSTAHINNDFAMRQENYDGIGRYEIGEEMLSWLYFDATGINMDKSGLVLEVYYDPQFMVQEAIHVPQSDYLKRNGAKADNGVLRIPMNDHITGGTSLGIPISWKFKKLETPQGYTAELNAVLRDANGNVLQISDPVKLTGFYTQASMDKRANGEDINGTIDADPKLAIDYRTLSNGEVTYTFRAKNIHRYIGEYVLSDTLPTYSKVLLSDAGMPIYDGGTVRTEQVRAVFDPAKNPGWMLSGDGKTVTYRQMNLHTITPNLPTLTLSFPNAATQVIFQNKADLTLVPHNRPDYEPVMQLTDTTSNQFNLEFRHVPWGGPQDYEMRAVSPHVHWELGTYMYDVQADRAKGIDWMLRGSAFRPKEDVSLSNMVYKFYNYDVRLQMDWIQAPWDGLVQAIDADRNPIGTPIAFNAGEKVSLPDSWRHGEGVQVSSVAAVSVRNGYSNVVVHTSLIDDTVDLYDGTAGATSNAFNADSSFTAKVTDHKNNDAVIPVDRTDPASVTLRQLVQTLNLTKSTSYPTNTSLRSDSTGDYELTLNHSVPIPDLARELKDVTVVDVLPAYITVDAVELAPEFAAAGGTYESHFLPGEYLNGNQQVLVFKAPSLKPKRKPYPNDAGLYTTVAKIHTRTNIQMDGQVLNTAYLGWSNHDQVTPYIPEAMTNISDNGGTKVSTQTLRDIGVTDVVGSADGNDFVPARVSFNLTKVKELSARKYIRVSENDSWVTTGVITKPGESFQYRLGLVNRMPTDGADPNRTGMEYYDVLPTPGDVGITTGERRGSFFANHLVSVKAPAGYDVWYTTDVIDMTKFNNQKGPDAYLPTLNWVALTGELPDSTVATAVRIKAQNSVKFGPGDVLNFDFNMKAPTNISLFGKRAWNSYVRGDDSSSRLLEPNAVYNEIGRPDSSIELRKVSAGTTHKPLAGAVFGLYQSDGSWVATATSDDQGKVRFENINSNLDYEIRELQAPVTENGQSFSLITSPIKVTSKQLINSNYNLQLGDVENTLPWKPIKPVRGSIELQKVNQDRDPIQGIQFRLTGEFSFASLIQNGFNPTAEWTLNQQMQIEMIASSNSEGRVVFENLPMGRYKVEEVNNPYSAYHGDWSKIVTLTNKDAPLVSPRVVLDGPDAVVNDKVQVRITKLGILNPEKANIAWQKLNSLDGVALKGAKFEVVEKLTGNVAAEVTTGDDGTALAQGLKPATVYQLRETVAPYGYEPYSGDPIEFQVSKAGELLDGAGTSLWYRRIYVPNERKKFTSSVTVKKVDATNEQLVVPGAKFLLEKRNDQGVFEPYSNDEIPADGTLTTNDTGVAVFVDLDQGVYRLSEVSAPAGYLATFQPVVFTVSNAEKRDYQYIAKNPPTGVHLTKVEMGVMRVTEAQADEYIGAHPGFEKIKVGSYFNVVKNLPGASFAIYQTKQVNGNLIADVEAGAVETITTGANGLATTTVPLDVNTTYAAIETQAPNGYHAVTNPYFFRIADLKANEGFDGIVRLTVPNNADVGQITVTKYSDRDRRVMPGVVFSLYKRADGESGRGTYVGQAVTSQDGMAIFSGLELGYAYTLVEVGAPAGFKLSEDIDVGVLDSQARVKSFVVYNYELELQLLKTDRDGNPLQGAEFGLFADSNSTTPISTAISDPDGKVKFTGVEAGNYVVKEITAPAGYTAKDISYQVNLDQSGKVTVIDPEVGQIDAIVNDKVEVEPIQVQLEAEKTLTGGDLVAGQFTFELRDEQGEVIQTVTNDADGKIKFSPLSYSQAGEHTYTILEVPGNQSGYTYDAAVHQVKVKVSEVDYKLVGEVGYETGKKPVFVNTFTPTKPKKLPKTGV